MALRTDYSAADHTRLWEHLNEVGQLGNAHVAASVPFIQQGSVAITPTAANTPTSVAVTYPTPFAAGSTPRPMVTPNTTSPGTLVTGTGATSNTATGFIAWLTRTNTTTTTVFWLAVGTK